MFDIGWQELFIVAVLAVIVVGPKELPRVLRTVMGVVRKARMLARDFQDGLDEVVREADLEDIKNQIGNLGNGDLAKTVESTLDPNGDIAKELDMTEIQNDIGKMAADSSTSKPGDDGTTDTVATDAMAASTAESTADTADDKKDG